MATPQNPVLKVQDLAIEFDTNDGAFPAVSGVSFTLQEGEVLGIVGESGSGKSVTARAIMGLLPTPPAHVTAGSVVFEGKELLTLPKDDWQEIRGQGIAMVFQEPVAALNPVMRIGNQLVEAIKAHDGKTGNNAAWDRAVELLKSVHVPSAETRAKQYPHQLSGGMAQRVAIALAIANEPRVLIADEPTTALDVTVQAQVMKTLGTVRKRINSAMILITHDLGLIAEVVDRVVVMYAGRVVESGPIAEIFQSPRHPYTLGLMASIPRLDENVSRLRPIRGQPPSISSLPSGCAFSPRCDLGLGRAICASNEPPLRPVGPQHESACHFVEELIHTTPLTLEKIDS